MAKRTEISDKSPTDAFKEATQQVFRRIEGKVSRAALRARARKVLTGDEQRRIRDVVQEELAKPVRVKLRDKLSFTMGVLNMLLTEHILLTYPQHFWLWYIFWTIPLMALRIYTYNKLNYQYFLFDFCYFVQVLCLTHLILFPASNLMFEIIFACANGPLLFAIMAWRNSLVFHSLDKITSMFIHAFPPLLTWAERWYGNFTHEKICLAVQQLNNDVNTFPPDVGAVPLDVSPDNPVGAEFDACDLTWVRMLGYPLVAYVCWQISYFFKTEVQDRELLQQDKSIETSARWFLRSKKGVLYSLSVQALRKCKILGPDEYPEGDSWFGKAIFMFAQFIYTLITMVPVKLMYENFWFHTLSLVVVITNAIWNGATYYIEVFSSRYQGQVEKALEKYNNLIDHHNSRTRTMSSESGMTGDVADAATESSLMTETSPSDNANETKSECVHHVKSARARLTSTASADN